MAKRLTDCDKWVKNKWFRKLDNKYKLFWLYLLDQCDNVGVWEEDIEFAELVLNEKYEVKDILNIFNSQIKTIRNGKKWWVKDFCFFQYGELKEENINNKPHQSFIALLKKHSLWIDYKMTIQGQGYSLKDKDIDIDKDKDKDKDKKNMFKKPTIREIDSYAVGIGFNLNAEKFYNSYEQKNWMVGKNKMKNWKAAVRNWKANGWGLNQLSKKERIIQGIRNEQN